MSRSRSHGADRCPSDDSLLALVCGELAAPALSRVLRHAEACAACAVVIAEAGLVRGETEPRGASGPAARPRAVFEVGQLVASRYLIERRLGRGGMGEVYVALDRELSERVALKTVSTTLAADPRAVKRLKQELRLARSVSHPHVCRVLELGRHELQGDRAQWFFTLQLIDGASLRHRLLRGQPPSREEALSWAEQLARGLAAIHGQSVIHRDIKPENVMLTSVDGPALALWVDFGLARVDLSDTRSPALLEGTPDYAAPELLRGAVASRASDIYALGLLLCELFTGSRPPRLADLSARGERAEAASLPPGSQLPPMLAELLRQCMASEPEHRPPSAEAIARRLLEVRRSDERSMASSPGGSGRRWLTLAALAFALIGAALLARASWKSAPIEPAPPPGAVALVAPVAVPPRIASTPAAPPREALTSARTPARRAAPPSSSSPAEPAAAALPAEPALPRITDFGGRR